MSGASFNIGGNDSFVNGSVGYRSQPMHLSFDGLGSGIHTAPLHSKGVASRPPVPTGLPIEAGLRVPSSSAHNPSASNLSFSIVSQETKEGTPTLMGHRMPSALTLKSGSSQPEASLPTVHSEKEGRGGEVGRQKLFSHSLSESLTGQPPRGGGDVATSPTPLIDPVSALLKTRLSTDEMKELNANLMLALHKARSQLHALRKRGSKTSPLTTHTVPKPFSSDGATTSSTFFHFQDASEGSLTVDGNNSSFPNSNSGIEGDEEEENALHQDSNYANRKEVASAIWLLRKHREGGDTRGSWRTGSSGGGAITVQHTHNEPSLYHSADGHPGSDGSTSRPPSGSSRRNPLVTFVDDGNPLGGSGDDRSQQLTQGNTVGMNGLSATMQPGELGVPQRGAPLAQSQSMPMFFPIGGPLADSTNTSGTHNHRQAPKSLPLPYSSVATAEQRCLAWRHRLAVLEVNAIVRMSSESSEQRPLMALLSEAKDGGPAPPTNANANAFTPYNTMSSSLSSNFNQYPNVLGVRQYQPILGHSRAASRRCIQQLPMISQVEASRVPPDPESIRSLFCQSMQRVAASNAECKAKNTALRAKIDLLAEKRRVLLADHRNRKGTIDWITMGPLPRRGSEVDDTMAAIHNSTFMLAPQQKPSSYTTSTEATYSTKQAIQAATTLDTLLSRPATAAISQPPTARTDSLCCHVTRLHRELVWSRGHGSSNQKFDGEIGSSGSINMVSNHPLPEAPLQLSRYLQEATQAMREGTEERRWEAHYNLSLLCRHQGAASLHSALESFGEEAS